MRQTWVLPYNDPRRFGEINDLVAAVIVEPVAANMGVVPPAPGFLEALREVTRRQGALLIFDEVITGFRLAWGGAQTIYKRHARPDLSRARSWGEAFPSGLSAGRQT